MQREPPRVRLERGERCRSAHVSNPRPGRRLGRDFGYCTVGNAQEDEVRVGGVERHAALEEAAAHCRADAPARAHDANTLDHVVCSSSRPGYRATGKCALRSYFSARRATRRACTPGQSSSVTLNHALSRFSPPRTSMCLRWTPSNVAPRAARAPHERSLEASVLNSTLRQPQLSNACCSCRSLASTFAPVPHADGCSHVQPISTERCSGLSARKRVEPTTWSWWIVTKGISVPAAAAPSAWPNHSDHASGVCG